MNRDEWNRKVADWWLSMFPQSWSYDERWTAGFAVIIGMLIGLLVGLYLLLSQLG